MTPPNLCISCGSALSPGRLRGLCPRCLMRGAVVVTHELDREDRPAESFCIPGHENLRELARGGMGIVYQARQIAPQREVAIKMLLPQSITDELRERFRLEARTMADLNHPGILPLHQFGEWAGVPFFTMKLASGGTLAERRARFAGEWRKIATLLAELADAVAHAHAHGVLHRDLKPGNILFDETDRAYVADFGLVKIANTDSNLTRSIAMLGTPQYLAPEVAAKDARMATVRSDVYSLGAILYELLAQRPPFVAEGLPALLREIAETEPSPLRKLGVPLDLATITHTALAKDPSRRYESAAAFAADLRSWLAGEAIAARPVSSMERVWLYAKRHPALAALSMLLAAAVITGVVIQQRANASLRATSHQALTQQVNAIRQSGQWELRDAGLEAAREAALLGNDLDLRSDAITLLATPGFREVDRRPFHQTTWTAIMPNGEIYAEVQEKRLWLRTFKSSIPDEEISPPDPSLVFQEATSFSGDGNALLVCFEGSLFRIWQVKEKAWAEVKYAGVWGLVFSADGQSIAYGEIDGKMVTIEDWRHPTQRIRFSSALTNPAPKAFSPDGKWLAIVARESGTLEIHDTATGETVHTLENPRWSNSFFPVVAWRPDSQAIAIGTGVTDLFVWYLDGPSPHRRRFMGHHSELQGVAWHPSGEWLATIGFDYTLRLWELSSGRTGAVIPAFGYDLQFSTDGRTLLVNDTNRHELVRYGMTVPNVVRHVALPRQAPDENIQRGPWGVALSPDGKFAVVGGSLGTWILDAADGRKLLKLSTGLVNEVSFAPEGGGFWICAPGRGIYQSRLSAINNGVWSVTAPQLVWGTRLSMARMSQSPATGLIAATAGDDLWLVPTRGEHAAAQKLTLPGVPMNPVKQSPDGRWIVSASCDNHAELSCVWDVQTRTLVHRLPDTLQCYMVFSPDSRTLYTASHAGLAAWDVGTWAPRWTRPNPGALQVYNYPVLSGDGHTLAISRNSHGVDLIDPTTGALLATLDHPDARSIGWLALDHTGSRLAINGSQYNIQLWDLHRLRTSLATLHLDWSAPPIPAPDPTPVQGIILTPN